MSSVEVVHDEQSLPSGIGANPMRFVAHRDGGEHFALTGIDDGDRVVQAIRDIGPLTGRMKCHAGRVTSHGDFRHFLPAVRVDHDHGVRSFAGHVELWSVRMNGQPDAGSCSAPQ